MAMLGDEAQKLGRKAFFLLNNRLEGSAPHSVGALLDSLSTIRS
jgi:hypothetical protein